MEASVLEINVLSRQKSKYFKAMTTFYKVLQVFWGFDFGFFEYKSSKRRILWNSITIIKSIIFISVCLVTLQDQEIFYMAVWYYVTVIHYILNILCLLLSNPNRTFYKLFFKLDSIDLKLSLHSALLNSEMKMMIIIVLHLSFCILFGGIYCLGYEACSKPFGIYILFTSLYSCLYFVHITYGFMFYLINCRLKILASILRTDRLDFTSLQQIYKSIIELAEEYKAAFDPVFVVALLSNVPEMMASIYYIVTRIQNEISEGLCVFRLEYIVTVEGLMLTFVPAIFAGMLSSETEKIKIILHDKLMQDLDVCNVRKIKRFIRYVEARGCRFRVCKVIPLDADLVGMVLSFCVSYLIVIIQFTNK